MSDTTGDTESGTFEQKLVNLPPGKRRRVVSPPPATKAANDETDEDDDDDDDLQGPEFEPPKIPADVRPRRAESPEDLYASFPTIGDGRFKVRVERLLPKAFFGQQIAGFLGDFDEPLSADWIRDRFGGGQYSVCVMGPSVSGSGYQTKTTKLIVNVPGQPVMAGNEEGPPMQRSPFGFQQPIPVPLEHQTVQLERIKREERRELADRNLSDGIVKTMNDSHERSLERVTEQANAQIQVLREQNQNQLVEIQSLRSQITALQSDVLKAKSDTDARVREAESTMERRIKEEYQRQLNELKDTSMRTIEQLKEQHQRDMREQEARANDRLNTESRRFTEELARKDSAARDDREKLARENERSERTLRETYDQRVNELQRSSEREIAAIKENRDRECATVRLQAESAIKATDATTKMQLDLLNRENAKLIVRNESLEKENARLLHASIKDPIQYIRETQEVASSVLGMIPASEAGGDKEEDLGDWKKIAARGFLDFMSNLPETAKGVMGQVQQARAQNQQQAAAAAAHQQQQQAMMAEQQQGMVLSAGGATSQQGQPQRRQRRLTRADINQPYMGPVQGAEIPFQHPYAQIHNRPPPSPHANGVPVVPLMQDPPVAAPPSPQQAAAQSASQPQAAPAQPAQQPQPQQELPPGMTQEQAEQQQRIFEEFVSELDNAIAGGMIPSKMFAQKLVERAGADDIRMMLGRMSAEQFLAMLDHLGIDNDITTVDGKGYVKQLWAEVRKLVGA